MRCWRIFHLYLSSMNKVLAIFPLIQNAQNLNDYKLLLPTHTEIPLWFQMDLQGESSFVLSVNKWTFSSLLQLWFLLPKAKSSPKQPLIISMPFPGGEWVDGFPSASVSPCCALPCRTLSCFSHLSKGHQEISLVPSPHTARKLEFCPALLPSGLMGCKRGRLMETSGKDLPTLLLLKTALTQGCVNF